MTAKQHCFGSHKWLTTNLDDFEWATKQHCFGSHKWQTTNFDDFGYNIALAVTSDKLQTLMTLSEPPNNIALAVTSVPIGLSWARIVFSLSNVSKFQTCTYTNWHNQWHIHITVMHENTTVILETIKSNYLHWRMCCTVFTLVCVFDRLEICTKCTALCVHLLYVQHCVYSNMYYTLCTPMHPSCYEADAYHTNRKRNETAMWFTNNI